MQTVHSLKHSWQSEIPLHVFSDERSKEAVFMTK